MIGYGEGVPDVKWIYVNGSQRNVTINQLSKHANISVVSSEIPGRKISEKFILIFREISANLLIAYMYMSISCFQVQHCKAMLKNKHVLDKQLCRSLRFNCVHYVQKK